MTRHLYRKCFRSICKCSARKDLTYFQCFQLKSVLTAMCAKFGQICIYVTSVKQSNGVSNERCFHRGKIPEI